MNTSFIDSFRKPKLHGNFIMDLHPFVKLNLLLLIATFSGVFSSYLLRALAIVFYFIIAALPNSGVFLSRSFFQKATVAQHIFGGTAADKLTVIDD